MNILKLSCGLLLLLIVGVVFLLGYFGFIPGLSSLLGTDKPKDLGIKYTQMDYESALEKGGGELKKLPTTSTESILYEGSHKVKEKFTTQELTALAQEKEEWVDYPLENLQIRINDDDTCEIAGIIKLTKIQNLVSTMGISDADYKKALEKVNIPLKDVPFYAKGLGTAKNNTFDVSLTNFEVGRFPVPKSILDKYQGHVAKLGTVVVNSIPGANIKEARFENNSIYFEGSIPSIEYTKR